MGSSVQHGNLFAKRKYTAVLNLGIAINAIPASVSETRESEARTFNGDFDPRGFLTNREPPFAPLGMVMITLDSCQEDDEYEEQLERRNKAMIAKASAMEDDGKGIPNKTTNKGMSILNNTKMKLVLMHVRTYALRYSSLLTVSTDTY